MLFRNSIRLLMENFKNVYKILLYQVIVGIVAGALCVAMILPQLLELVSSAPMQDLISGAKSFFQALLSANATELEMIKEELFGDQGAFQRFAELLLSRRTGIVLGTLGCVVVYLFAF